jgi:hypothetical protein
MGKFQEAAKLFSQANRVERAIAMYSDLCRWDEARQFAHNANPEHSQELVRRQAAWAEETNDLGVASETYLKAGDILKAISILGEQKWLDKLAEVARGLSRGQTAEMQACLKYFQKHKSHAHARELLLQLGDIAGLLALNLEHNMWDDALQLIAEHPAYAPQVYLPYAQWLAEQDRFVEAQGAYTKAGQGEQSLRMLETLTHNAVVEHRFPDAAYYLHLLSTERLGLACHSGPPSAAQLREYEASRRTAEQYFAYASVQKYTDEPFTALTPDTVFNIARYLLSWLLRDEAPFGISKTYCLFALAKQSKTLRANKLARFALEKLTQFKVPSGWQEQVGSSPAAATLALTRLTSMLTTALTLSTHPRPHPYLHRSLWALAITLRLLLPSGGRLRALDPGPALHRRRGADALLLPLPDDQPAAQPGRRSGLLEAASWWRRSSAARPPRTDTDPPGSGLLRALNRSARAAHIAMRGCGATVSACQGVSSCALAAQATVVQRARTRLCAPSPPSSRCRWCASYRSGASRRRRRSRSCDENRHPGRPRARRSRLPTRGAAARRLTCRPSRSPATSSRWRRTWTSTTPSPRRAPP